MYSNAQYVEVNHIRVEINGTICVVPLDPANADYRNIMALVEKGELTIAPATTQ